MTIRPTVVDLYSLNHVTEVARENLQGNLIKGNPLNPGHYFWETLITDFKCPFLKRELILVNPAEVVFTWRWAEVIKAESEYDPGLIYRHLQTN
jgi:hypothetical protein